MKNYLSDCDRQCLTCIHYDLDESYKKSDRYGYACDHWYRTMAFDESCRRYYEFDRHRTNEEINRAVENRKKWGYDGTHDDKHW